ncbi:hypothetical protein BB381_03810 [Campylobacter pinnipediorum subsp. caledonicus]|uniref:DMT family transporter n=1 Tax=Campylobacter pinnipediorum TaxID=1965231 RepID=UPI000994DF6B|nr:DMT family transporter [Campylobacter pinnipediorum]OPA71627.1 hypothetical protein BB381_03810 [Campylobacter pinnipediorum subsp. caledonicus]
MITGISYALASGLFWAFDSISISKIPLFYFFIAGIHDLFIFLYVFLFCLFRKIQFAHIKFKTVVIISLASCLGGICAISSYLLCAKYSSIEFAGVVSAFYPVIAILGLRFILKEKIGIYAYISICFCILSLLFVVNVSSFSIIAMFFGLLSATLWASELIIISIVLKKDINPIFALLIREFFSSFYYVLIFSIFFMNNIEDSFKHSYSISIAAFFGTISYALYYFSIQKIGAVKAMVLNMSYCIWIIILTYDYNPQDFVFTILSAFSIICACMFINLNDIKRKIGKIK